MDASVNGNRPAFPNNPSSTGGMTKREYMATHLLSGMLADPAMKFKTDEDFSLAACGAVSLADALLVELAK